MDRKVIIISYKSRLSRWGMCSVAISDNIKIVMEQEAGTGGNNSLRLYTTTFQSCQKGGRETATNFLGRGKCDDGKVQAYFSISIMTVIIINNSIVGFFFPISSFLRADFRQTTNPLWTTIVPSSHSNLAVIIVTYTIKSSLIERERGGKKHFQVL